MITVFLLKNRGLFHGCQHNGQSPAAFASAVALAEFMEKQKLPGTIKIFGTPAEEMGPPAKVIMFEAGVFDGTDLIVRSHGTGETTRNKPGFGVCCLNINEVKYIFEGRPAHQRSSWNGRNALTAAVQFYTTVDHLRPTFRPEAVIQGVIPEGGVAPNVVPDRAVVDYYIRYPDEVYLAHMDAMIANAARGAALATGTKVTIDRYGEYRDGITVGSLEELAFAYAEKLDAPEINPEPQRPAGYEETGFVTRKIPGVSVSVYSSSAPGHSYERWLDSMKEVGHTGFLLDAKVMAAILYHYLTDDGFKKTVHMEHKTMAGLFNNYLDALKDAYKEEIKKSFSRFAKSVEDTITIAPEIKKFMDENRVLQQQMKQKSNAMLSGSIVSSAVFIGSAFLFQTNETLGTAGMIASVAIFGIFAIFRKK